MTETLARERGVNVEWRVYIAAALRRRSNMLLRANLSKGRGAESRS